VVRTLTGEKSGPRDGLNVIANPDERRKRLWPEVVARQESLAGQVAVGVIVALTPFISAIGGVQEQTDLTLRLGLPSLRGCFRVLVELLAEVAEVNGLARAFQIDPGALLQLTPSRHSGIELARGVSNEIIQPGVAIPGGSRNDRALASDHGAKCQL
jgi:hypothetical protein